MGTSNEKAIARLRELIQIDSDAIVFYEKALEHVDDFDARTDFEAFLGEHDAHVGELTKLAFDMGGEPPPANVGWKTGARRMLTDWRSTSGTKGALKAMRANERRTIRAYEDAIEHELPEAAIYAVSHHLADERRHLAIIEGHLARLEQAGTGAEAVDASEAPPIETRL